MFVFVGNRDPVMWCDDGNWGEYGDAVFRIGVMSAG